MNRTKTALKTALAAIPLMVASYQALAPNTALDKAMAKRSCTSTTPREEPKTFDISVDGKLDYTFKEMRTGDRISYNGIELIALDSRPQCGSYGPNTNGSPTMFEMDCPGYVKLDVSVNGKQGDIVELVYGSRIIGAGGIFDGWPSYNLDDVLEKAGLDAGEVITDADAREAALDAQQHRQENAAAEQYARHEFKELMRDDARYRRFVRSCKTRFRPTEEGFAYRIRDARDRNWVAHEFDRCNSGGAFMPIQLRDVSIDTRGSTAHIRGEPNYPPAINWHRD